MSQNNKSLIVIALMLSILLAVGYLTYYLKNQSKINQSPANISLNTDDSVAPYTDMSGNVVSLADKVGENLIVTSWASWSPASKQDLQLLAQISRDYDINVVAINRAENVFVAERYLKSIQVSEDVELILDPDDSFYKSISGYAMPETIIYDETGAVRHHFHGEVDAARINEILDSLYNG